MEKNEEFAINKRRDRDVLKGKHVDMVNVGKELKITLDDVDTKVRRGDPEWKRQQKQQLASLLDPTDPTLMERDKYKKLIIRQIKTREFLSEHGLETDRAGKQTEVLVDSSISSDLLGLFKSALLAMGLLLVFAVIIYYAIIFYLRCQQYHLIPDGEAEVISNTSL